MAKPLIKIHDIQTGKIVEREMTDAEFEQYKLDQIAENKRIADLEAKAQAKAELLSKLGISAEEAQLLLS